MPGREAFARRFCPKKNGSKCFDWFETKSRHMNVVTIAEEMRRIVELDLNYKSLAADS